MRKAIVLGMAAAATATAGCSRANGESPGPATTRNFQVAGFERLEVGGPYEVTVTTGSAPSVRASGGERAIEKMIVEVENGTLRIYTKKRSGINFGWSSGKKDVVKLVVTVPRLTAAEIAGSGSIAVDKVAGDTFDAGVAGSGALRLGQVEVKRLKAGIAGSGEIKAGQGRATVVDYEIAGSGGIDAGAIVAEVASVSIAGSGEVSAHATSTASVDIAGSGDVRVTGGGKCTVSKAGSGNVHCS